MLRFMLRSLERSALASGRSYRRSGVVARQLITVGYVDDECPRTEGGLNSFRDFSAFACRLHSTTSGTDNAADSPMSR